MPPLKLVKIMSMQLEKTSGGIKVREERFHKVSMGLSS
jgi:hypothetical protein